MSSGFCHTDSYLFPFFIGFTKQHSHVRSARLALLLMELWILTLKTLEVLRHNKVNQGVTEAKKNK